MKKLLGLLLAVALVFSMVVVLPVYAEAGSAEEPIFLMDVESQVDVPANATVYYQGWFAGMNVTVTGEGDFAVIYNGETIAAVNGAASFAAAAGMGRMPVGFAIVGTDADATYSIVASYPVGTMMNPEVITESGFYTASVTEGSMEGYNYTFTAPADGEVTVDIITESGWQYAVNNMTTYVYGDMHWSDDDPVVASETIAVSAGDEITIMITTYDPNSWVVPAGSVDWLFTFVEPAGSENNPIFLMDVESEITVPANTTLYYQGWFAGMDVTIAGEGDFTVIYNGQTIASENGVVSFAAAAGMGRMPVVFAVVGTDAEATYQVSAEYPAGTMMNPEVITESGDYTANVTEGSMEGYNYTWTAPADGEVVITMVSESGWQYVVNNMTTYAYGDMHWSDDDPVVNSETLTVSAGDEITIMITTYDPNSWVVPAGSVEWNLSFDDGNEEQPGGDDEQGDDQQPGDDDEQGDDQQPGDDDEQGDDNQAGDDSQAGDDNQNNDNNQAGDDNQNEDNNQAGDDQTKDPVDNTPKTADASMIAAVVALLVAGGVAILVNKKRVFSK